MAEIPKGWKVKSLGDILTAPQLREVKKYLNRKDANPQGLIKVLQPHRKSLLEKGVLPEYLGYALWHEVERRKLRKLA